MTCKKERISRHGRRFRTGYRAGLAAAAMILVLLGATAPSPAQARSPSARASFVFPTPIQHIVVIYQENHSFDEVLGNWCASFSPPRCNGFTGAVRLADGKVVTMQPSPDVVPNVDHSVNAQVAAMDGGKMDGWDRVGGCSSKFGYLCLTYYKASQIPNLTALATRFGVSDATFSMADSPSWGGHLYAVAATTDGFAGTNPRPVSGVTVGPGWGCDSNKTSAWLDPATGVTTQQPSCVPDPALTNVSNGGAFRPSAVPDVPTIMDRLDAVGMSWRMYAALPNQGAGYTWSVCPSFAGCLDTSQRNNLVPTNNVLSDAAAGTLPNFSLVLPGAGLAAGASQHNTTSMLKGDNWIGTVVSAIEHGPNWGSTAIFITYDDCGCFYDHVTPHTNPDGTQQGPRVPLVIVSPYVKAGYTDSTPASFASILAYEEQAFELTPLGATDSAAYKFSNAFDYSQTPLPGVSMVHSPIPPGEVTHEDPDDPT
jgi:phospholipase C